MKLCLSFGLFYLGLLFLSASPSSAASLGPGASALGKAAQSSRALVQVKKRRRYYRRRRGRNAALGILGAAAAAAIVSEAVRAEERRGRPSCRTLDYRCSRGSRRACYDFDEFCY